MTNLKEPAARPGAKVDHLVDERGQPVDVADGSSIRPARDVEETVGATGPTNWWVTGLAAMAIVIAVLLVLQLLGGTPGTDVQPGTPTAAPETTPL